MRVLGDAGCTVESLNILEGGVWSVYVSGAPGLVNATFPAALPSLAPFVARCK